MYSGIPTGTSVILRDSANKFGGEYAAVSFPGKSLTRIHQTAMLKTIKARVVVNINEVEVLLRQIDASVADYSSKLLRDTCNHLTC